MEWGVPASPFDIGEQFFGAHEFQKMIGFVPSLLFLYVYPGHPEHDHPAGREGRGKDLPVHIHQFIKGKPPGNLLNIPLGKNDVIIIHKHALIIIKPAGDGNRAAGMGRPRRGPNACLVEIQKNRYYS
jgi:hypothetical protein